MTREEAKEVFLNRGFIDGIYNGDKWREACIVISKWLEQEPCEDVISRKSIKQKLQEHHDFFVNAYGGFSNLPQNDKSRVDEITNCIAMVVNEPSVTPQEPCDKCEVTFKDDNAVSRLSVRDIIYINAYELEYPDGSSEYVVNRDELIKYLMELSPVYPKSDKPSGKWIKVHPLQENDEGDYMCSECKCGGLVWKPTTYCPNCGCRMVES